MFPHQLIGISEGVLIIIFRKRISVFLERVYKKLPINKISGQFYNVSYRVRPVFLTILGAIIIGLSVLSLFSTY